MRYGTDHKPGSRHRILQAAARQIRSNGPHRIALGEVMAAAGLTHGAFYAHFGSKDELVAEAVAVMFADARDRASSLEGVLASDDAALPAAFGTYLRGYLSPRHRDAPERGCPLPSLAADMARTGDQARGNFVAGMQRMTAGVETVLARMERTHPASEARAVVAQMVGAMALARATGPGPESDAMLHDSLAALLAKLDL